VIVVGAIVLTVLFLLIHYWKRIILLFAPLMGDTGKRLQARWASQPDPHSPAAKPTPATHEKLS
jgi:hypothetical protein